ncbi:catalase HPII [Lawsonia intracellularis]|uniref:Catalase n=1 Tax=Lawsonia intracellularis (strain PHE/MN1-00) TaxID=363253 RepID=Q1MQ31_LAWIP|nr:catalase HPII [Lawsonia intracellularis]AGC50267.1 catalase [Lawsonia intracellularis N343]KAA0204288.1 catalase HPII [Lawsonia intracellularis]MBZ3892709.1 catalase HPII [Lawsonia intracellularis]RBN33125.1 catalase HPII [Lawsonia intracellularis]RBN35050.1 catalase HPII [Lawsonia intracellularis]
MGNNNNDNGISVNSLPFRDGKSAEPHYSNTIPQSKYKISQRPTPPGVEPMTSGSFKTPDNTTEKIKAMDSVRVNGHDMAITTNLGVKIANNQNTLRAGVRGPSLLEDFHLHEKLAHFHRERIPERVVHARGSGAYGYFQVYKSMRQYTKAAFLQDPGVKTPVFVRFSTVQGFRGSPDTARDLRGWATKFYTQEGNFDLVGNNTAVFFIQDAIKFPDFVHAVKPEPHNEVPQGQSAHDNFWDYVSLQPETLHNVMWAMSDRGIPRSYRMMEGFGIHTFRLINEQDKSCFVRFHWKPVYGTSSLLWDEAQILTGRDPDFHRKDLWQAIEAGDYPEYELGLQIIPEEDEHKFDFDILDATKLIPEALVPIELVGKMVLNRNPDNFFAETEQAAFCPANIVPGIDFSDDPLLQGRIFSYFDTQLHRLGGPNFNEIPINRPICPVTNQQRDGNHRMQIDSTVANYEPNTVSGNWPREVQPSEHGGGFTTYKSKVEGTKVRERSPSFFDYYSQPRLFWLSQTAPEQKHIIDAFSFELSKVMRPYIRERIVDLLSYIDRDLAKGVATNLGLTLSQEQLSYDLPKPVNGLTSDPSLSLYAKNKQNIKSRRVALLVADGVSKESIETISNMLHKEGVYPQFFAPHMGSIKTEEGNEITVDGTIEGNPSVVVDAVIVPQGKQSLNTLLNDGNAKYYLCQAYKHLKPIGLPGNTKEMLSYIGLSENDIDEGLVLAPDSPKMIGKFIDAMKQHRIWSRESKITSFSA